MLTEREAKDLDRYRRFIEYFGVSEMSDEEFKDYMKLDDKEKGRKEMVAVMMRIDGEVYGPFTEIDDAIKFASEDNPYIKTHIGKTHIGNFGEEVNKIDLPWTQQCQGHYYAIYGYGEAK